jgi:sensor histidine kinase YesM
VALPYVPQRYEASARLVVDTQSALRPLISGMSVQSAEAERQAAAERERAAVMQRQATDAQLRVLQAQIEPHFLFNTLANVIGLIEHQPAEARRMLERLIALLRASLSASRADRVSLAQELDLCRAYLEIVAIRMAGRLHYAIEADDAVRGRSLPPLLLQPLVENAIQHGLEPKVEGGRVRIVARARADGALDLTVEDDGIGFGVLKCGVDDVCRFVQTTNTH